MDLDLIVALAALALALSIDVIQTRSIRGVDRFLKDSRDVGTQFGDWLLRKDKTPEGEEITNLEACSRVMGHSIANSFSMGLKGIQSGEARTVRGIERKILESMESPETKALLEYVDSIGVPRELAGIVYDQLQKRGLLDGIIKNNGSGVVGESGWKL